MGSDSKEPAKPRFRFNFSGKNRRAKNADTSREDVLGSLKRQTHPQGGPGEDVRVLEIVETRDANQFQGPDVEPVLPARTGKKRGSLPRVLAIFLGGFFAIWLYGRVTGAYEIPYLNGFIQNSDVQVGLQLVSANPILFGLISAGALLVVLYATHRR